MLWTVHIYRTEVKPLKPSVHSRGLLWISEVSRVSLTALPESHTVLIVLRATLPRRTLLSPRHRYRDEGHDPRPDLPYRLPSPLSRLSLAFVCLHVIVFTFCAVFVMLMCPGWWERSAMWRDQIEMKAVSHSQETLRTVPETLHSFIFITSFQKINVELSVNHKSYFPPWANTSHYSN